MLRTIVCDLIGFLIGMLVAFGLIAYFNIQSFSFGELIGGVCSITGIVVVNWIDIAFLQSYA